MGVKFNSNPVRIKTPQVEAFFDADFHPSKEGLLALSTVEGNVHFVDVSKQTTVLSLDKWHKGSSIRKVRFSPDGKTLVTGAKVTKLYDLDAGVCIRKLDTSVSAGSGGSADGDGSARSDRVYSLVIVDHYLLATGHDSGTFNLWDYRTEKKPVMSISECSEYISDMDVNEGRKTIAASSGEGTLTAFNIRARRMELPQSELFDSSLTSVCFLDSRKKCLVGSDEGIIQFFNVNEWGNISTRYPIKNCTSITSIRRIADSTVLLGDDSGITRALNILPNRVINKWTHSGAHSTHSGVHSTHSDPHASTLAEPTSTKKQARDQTMPIEAIAVQPEYNLFVSVSSQNVMRINYELVTGDEEESKKCKNDFFSDLVEEEEEEEEESEEEEEGDSDDDSD